MSDLSLESTSDDFSFGVAELARAEQVNARPAASPPAARPAPLPKTKNPGFDPYNSGVFDKRKAWTSIRKR